MKNTSTVALVVIMLSSASLQGAENMSFRGTLLEHPPCEINAGQPVEIDFGYVGVNKVDGINYAKTFTIRYVCDGTSVDMALRYVGNPTAFDRSAVLSNVPDFGIQLQHVSDGIATLFEVGSTLHIPSYSGSSTFIATPVRKAGADLQQGAFTAAATLQLEYP